MRINKFVKRLNLDDFTTILGEEVLELLDSLGFKVKKSSLASLSVDIYSKAGVLADKQFRERIFSCMKEDEAKRLAVLLGYSSGDPWHFLKSRSYGKRSNNMKLLYSYFSIELPPNDEDTDLKSAEEVQPQYPLFEHQRCAASELINVFNSQKVNPRALLHMPTGSGKTRTAMNVISRYLRDDAHVSDIVIWVAHSEELCTQASEEFKKAWRVIGNRRVNIFRHYSHFNVDFKKVESGVLFCGIQMLDSYLKTRADDVLSLASKTIMVVMDEAHQAVAPTYKQVLEVLCRENRVKLLGLSATPGRSFMDPGEDLKLADFFKYNKVKLRVEGYSSPVDFLTDQGYLAKVNYEYIKYTPTLSSSDIEKISNSFELPDNILRGLGHDQVRNLKIIQRIKTEVENGGKILVFACSVQHSDFLATVLRALSIKAESITSNTLRETRREAIQKFRSTSEVQVITNYGVLSTGFDAPRTNVAIITRPTKSVVLYSQMVGRATRGVESGGNKECKVITVQDEIPGFRSVAESFTFWEDIWDEK